MIKSKGLRRRLRTYSHTEPVHLDERDDKQRLVRRQIVGWRDVRNNGRTIGVKRCAPIEVPKVEWGRD